MAITQLSVFLENRPGQLAAAIRLISDAGVNLRALSLPIGLTVASDGDTISPTLTFTATTSLTLDILTAFGSSVDFPSCWTAGRSRCTRASRWLSR